MSGEVNSSGRLLLGIIIVFIADPQVEIVHYQHF